MWELQNLLFEGLIISQCHSTGLSSLFLSYKLDSHSRCGTEKLSPIHKCFLMGSLPRSSLRKCNLFQSCDIADIIKPSKTATSDFITWSRRRRGKIKGQKKKDFFSYFALSFSIDAHTSKCTHRRASNATKPNPFSTRHTAARVSLRELSSAVINWFSMSPGPWAPYRL